MGDLRFHTSHSFTGDVDAAGPWAHISMTECRGLNSLPFHHQLNMAILQGAKHCSAAWGG